MSESKIFDTNSDLGITRTWHYDEETDQATIQTSQNVTAIIEENRDIYNQGEKHDKWGEWSRVASIPLSVYFNLKAEGKLEDDAYMKRWLNDPENQYFRTRPGQV